IIPDLEPDDAKIPRGSVELEGGHVLLTAQDSCSREVRPCEEVVIREYLDLEFGSDVADSWGGSVVRWARLRLPNSQIARSLWKEQYMTQLRTARMVKIQIDEDTAALAEILFFFILRVGDSDTDPEQYLALASFFGPPDTDLLDLSSNAYWSFKHLRDADLRVVDVTSIISCVTMAPDHQYVIHRSDGSEIDRWFLFEKPRLKHASRAGTTESMNEDSP
ncbi:hypothetical protein R3P38DRAFT_2589663, partial [Favolaschia claudopus]